MKSKLATELFPDQITQNSNLVLENLTDWFSGSKVVSDDGAPLAVFHGTSVVSRECYSDNPEQINFDYDGPKFFSTSLQQASFYAKGSESTIISAYLSVKKPYEINEKDGGFAYLDGSEGGGIYDDTEYLRSHGYDGAVWRETGQPDVWVAFDSKQIVPINSTIEIFDLDRPDVMQANFRRKVKTP